MTQLSLFIKNLKFQTETLPKKIIGINIDIETQSIGFTVRIRAIDSLGVTMNEKTVSISATGLDFNAMEMSIPDGIVTLYQHISTIGYAYITGRV